MTTAFVLSSSYEFSNHLSIFCIVANKPSSLDIAQFAGLTRYETVVTDYLFSRITSSGSTIITQNVQDGLREEITVMFSWFELSLLIEENLSIFYRSQEPLTQFAILHIHHKYQTWYDDLPSKLVIDHDSPLRVLLLQ